MRLWPASILIVFATIIVACGESAPAETGAAAMNGQPGWSVDYSKSRLGFIATQAGNSFEGRFENFDARINFDPDDVSAASVDVLIDMTSARTGDRQRDIALPGEEWFATKTYPTAMFSSGDIEDLGAGAYVAHGRLTIKGVTKEVDLPFKLEINGDNARASGGLTIIRTDYGVGTGEFSTGKWVGLNVDIRFEISATR